MATGQFYGLDQHYLAQGSELLWIFSAPKPPNYYCVTRIYIFSTHSDYAEFLQTGEARNAVSYCLYPTSPLNFTLSAGDQYYFVGLKSFATTMINYTVMGDLLNYDVTGLSQTTCSFSAAGNYCPISLQDYPANESICILAALIDSHNFYSLTYTAVLSTKHYPKAFFALIGVFVSLFIIFILFISCCCFCAKKYL